MKQVRCVTGDKAYTTGGQVTGHPLPVAILVLLVAEHLLELIAESEVQGLGGEVTDDVGSVATPEGEETLIGSGALKAVNDAGVAAVKTASLDHLILYGCQHLICICLSQSADPRNQMHVTLSKVLLYSGYK